VIAIENSSITRVRIDIRTLMILIGIEFDNIDEDNALTKDIIHPFLFPTTFNIIQRPSSKFGVY